LEGGHKALTKHCFIKKGSFLEETCLWALVEVLRAQAGPPPDILRLVASLFVPDSAHGLAHPQRAVIGKRSPGATENVYAVEQIVAAVEGYYEREGFGHDKAVDEVAERLDASKTYIYRLLKEFNTQPRRRR
jgi:predicted transcriptional regulator YheO